MKTLYLDIFSGISGDMLLGALIDLGADPNQLHRELAKLRLEGYHLHVVRRQKGTIEGVKFDVHLDPRQHRKHAAESKREHAHTHAHTHDHGGGGDGAHSHEHNHSHDHGHE